MTGPDRNVWERLEPAWQAVFVLFAVLTAVLVAVSGTLPVAIAAGAAVLLVAAHLLLAVPAMRRDGPSAGGIGYLLLVWSVTLALFAADPAAAAMFFVLFPMLWRLLPTRAAVPATVLGVVATMGVVTLARPSDGPPLAVLALFGGATLCAVLLGLWITAIAGQNERRGELLAELERTRSELAAAHREAGVLAERERFARDVHDTLAQGFTSLTLLVRAASDELDADPAAARRHLALAEETARENLAEARALVAAATPAALGGDALPTAVRRLADRWAGTAGNAETAGTVETAGATVDLDGWSDTPERPVPADTAVAVLRVVQEALTNVRRHAGAPTVDVRLARVDGGIRVEIADDGRGFDPGVPAEGRYGLVGMQHRVAELGGVLTVRSAPGRGCVLTAWLPTAPDADEPEGPTCPAGPAADAAAPTGDDAGPAARAGVPG